MQTIGGRIRALRFSKGWGPERLAGEARVSRTAIYELESDRVKRPRAGTILLLALALGVTPGELLGLAEVPGHRTEAEALASIGASGGEPPE